MLWAGQAPLRAWGTEPPALRLCPVGHSSECRAAPVGHSQAWALSAVLGVWEPRPQSPVTSFQGWLWPPVAPSLSGFSQTPKIYILTFLHLPPGTSHWGSEQCSPRPRPGRPPPGRERLLARPAKPGAADCSTNGLPWGSGTRIVRFLSRNLCQTPSVPHVVEGESPGSMLRLDVCVVPPSSPPGDGAQCGRTLSSTGLAGVWHFSARQTFHCILEGAQD